MTVRDLIAGSLRLIGVLATNENPTANEATNALSSLNDMLDEWSTQQLLIVSKVTETFPLVVGQQSYQMGVGAPDFNTVRPQLIENALWQQPSGSTLFNLQIEIINQDQWAALPVPSTQSNIPTKMFPLMSYPYATLYFWPIPQAVNNLILWSWKPITQFATLDTVISMPPGYNKALRYNLGVELAPEYGKTLSPEIIAGAAGSKASIKRMNNKPILMTTDAALLPKKTGWNYFTGE